MLGTSVLDVVSVWHLHSLTKKVLGLFHCSPFHQRGLALIVVHFYMLTDFLSLDIHKTGWREETRGRNLGNKGDKKSLVYARSLGNLDLSFWVDSPSPFLPTQYFTPSHLFQNPPLIALYYNKSVTVSVRCMLCHGLFLFFSFPALLIPHFEALRELCAFRGHRRTSPGM